MTHPPRLPTTSPALEQALCSGDVKRVIAVAWPLFRARLERLALEAGVARDDVDDFMIDVYKDVHEGWAGFTGVGFQPWLFRVAGYVAKTYLNRRLRDRSIASPEVDGSFTPSPEARIDARRSLEIIAEVTAELSEADQRLVWAQTNGEPDLKIAIRLSEEFGKTYTAHAVTMRWLRIRGTFAKALAQPGKR